MSHAKMRRKNLSVRAFKICSGDFCFGIFPIRIVLSAIILVVSSSSQYILNVLSLCTSSCCDFSFSVFAFDLKCILKCFDVL